MGTLILVFAALFGASVGSFLNVCIFRLPRACLRLWKPKLSFCPGCRRTLSSWENIPVLAYIFLAGRCRTCKAPIPLRYFLVELGTACLFLYLAGRTLGGEERQIGLFLIQASFGAALIVCCLVDWDHRVIPDEIDIPGFLLAPILAFLVPAMIPRDHILAIPTLAKNAAVLLDSALPWWGLPAGATSGLTHPFHALHDALAHSPWALPLSAGFTSIVGAACGAGLIWTIGWAGERIFKKEAMGFGDVKFMAMIGGFTGWQGILAAIVLASITGSIYGIAHKIKSGTTKVTNEHLVYASPLSYLGLRMFGAPRLGGYRQLRALLKAKSDVVPLRPGAWVIARFATGDSYLPFGPFLALGAGVYAYWPEKVHDAVNWYSEHMMGLLHPR